MYSPSEVRACRCRCRYTANRAYSTFCSRLTGLLFPEIFPGRAGFSRAVQKGTFGDCWGMGVVCYFTLTLNLTLTLTLTLTQDIITGADEAGGVIRLHR